jgi:predicted PurR-regulated permease PerM
MIVYMLIDAERLRNLFLLAYPADERSKKRKLVKRVSRRMSSWLSGQLILAAVIGVTTFVGLIALRIPYALPLALIAAIGEMVPVIGPIIGAVPPLIVALFLSPWQFWAVLVMAILIQQAENLFLVPRLMSRKVSISPLAIFIAFMTGATLLGIIGAIMAVPAAVIIQVIFEEVFVSRRERRQTVGRPGTLVTEALREKAAEEEELKKIEN